MFGMSWVRTLAAATVGVLIGVVTGYHVYDWQWWALFAMYLAGTWVGQYDGVREERKRTVPSRRTHG